VLFPFLFYFSIVTNNLGTTHLPRRTEGHEETKPQPRNKKEINFLERQERQELFVFFLALLALLAVYFFLFFVLFVASWFIPFLPGPS
jgi:hypothetical protein